MRAARRAGKRGRWRCPEAKDAMPDGGLKTKEGLPLVEQAAMARMPGCHVGWQSLRKFMLCRSRRILWEGARVKLLFPSRWRPG